MRVRWLALVVLVLPCCSKFQDVLQVEGFSIVHPPSQLLAPGTVIYIKHAKPLLVGIVCDANESLGANITAYASPTLNPYLNTFLGVRLDLGAVGWPSQILPQLHLEGIDQIFVRLNHAVLLTLIDTQLPNMLQGRLNSCQQAIARRQKAGFTTTMVTEVFVADACFEVNWHDSAHVTAEQQQNSLMDLSATMGITPQYASSSGFCGNGLIWGINDDPLWVDAAQAGNGLPRTSWAGMRRKRSLLYGYHSPLVVLSKDEAIGDSGEEALADCATKNCMAASMAVRDPTK